MTRQCLYCAKELPKGSASNFCSKECWTEYKKLKAMNVGADKQATVLLKKSDIVGGLEELSHSSNASAHSSTDSSQATPRLPAEEINESQIHDLEQRLQNQISDLSVMIKNRTGQTNSQEYSDFIKKLDDLTTRISKVEMELQKVDGFLKAAHRHEDRVLSLEKKFRSMSQSEKGSAKRGFFGRLFG